MSDRRFNEIARPPGICAVSRVLNRRARLLASRMLCRGTLRSLVAAAGMVTVLGVSPAFAQCYSAGAGLSGSCNAVVPTGINATAVSFGANANGANATAIGSGSTANGINATATGVTSDAEGVNATAIGMGAFATGANASAIGLSLIHI